MLIWLLLLTTISFASTPVGEITKIIGSTKDAYVMRSSGKEFLIGDFELHEGDELHTENSFVVIHIYPSTQLSLSKKTEIKLSQNFISEASEATEKASSIIDFIKGLIRVQVTKEPDQHIDQKINAKGVVFGVRGTEFEVSDQDEGVDLDVIEGEVEVTGLETSEKVRSNEGFRFLPNKRKSIRRKFALKFRDHPGFINRKSLKEKWRKLKVRRSGLRKIKSERKQGRKRNRN